MALPALLWGSRAQRFCRVTAERPAPPAPQCPASSSRAPARDRRLEVGGRCCFLGTGVPQLLINSVPGGVPQASGWNTPAQLTGPSELLGLQVRGGPALQAPHEQCRHQLRTWREEEKARPSVQLLSQCCAKGPVKVAWPLPPGAWRVLKRWSPMWPQSHAAPAATLPAHSACLLQGP